MSTAIDTLLSRSPNVCGGRIRIDGTRITVLQIVTCYQQGLTPEEIADQYPQGKKAIAERNRLAEVLIKKLRKLGKYVEISCNDDVKTFLSSGFDAAPVARPSATSLTDSIRSIKAGPN